MNFKPSTFNLNHISFSVAKVNGKCIKYCFISEGFKASSKNINLITILDWKKHQQTYL